MDYQTLDSGNLYKLERFGALTLARPCPQAIWRCALDAAAWENTDSTFSREERGGWNKKLPDSWVIEHGGVRFLLRPTDFGHLGFFPEQKICLEMIAAKTIPGAKVLNLFAYSGGATLAAAKKGASVCHVDAAKGMVAWAKENQKLNELEEAPIRYIVEDVTKFLLRCKRRGERFDAIILDPPTFGRGPQGEVFKVERDLPPLLELCFELLSDNPHYLLLTSHTPGYTEVVLEQLLLQIRKGSVQKGEMVLEGKLVIPSGTWALWTP